MRITSKGQVTIPADIRTKVGLLPGTEVEFVADDGAVRIVPRRDPDRKGRRAHEVLRRLRGSATVRMTTDEIMALTRSS